MASADLRAELECSVCLNIYTDPVNLRCGHNFCRVCIDRVLDTQEGSGGYSCPECREKFQDRTVLEMFRDLEIKKDELSRKMRHIEEMCNMTDPLTVLQESDTGDLCDIEDGDDEDRERHDGLLHDGEDRDVAWVLHKGLSDIITEVNAYVYIQEPADILLDVNTAHNYLHISDDGKTASRSDIEQNRPETPERFQYRSQVLSSQSFSSGRHYWEVNIERSDRWSVGMCYPSIGRRGESVIGDNNKSWGLRRFDKQYGAIHNSKWIPFPDRFSSNSVRIYVDYEAGRISFYDLCDPIRHLHTFTSTFTEPLHAGLGVWRGCVKICGRNQEM